MTGRDTICMFTEAAAGLPANRGSLLRLETVLAVVAGATMLLAPAIWNGYPLLQYDTGGYLARWYEGYLVPSRSTTFGLYLHFGEGMHFWPQLVLQAACPLWIIGLVLRVIGLGSRPRLFVLIVSALALTTSLPFLTSLLLTDIFSGVSVLAIYLLSFHRHALGRLEQGGLLLLIAFSAASHSATLAVLIAVLMLSAFLSMAWRLSDWRSLSCSAAGIAAGAAMLLITNFAFSGQLAWTPGGYGILFGRMLQDGIVKRYLDDHCPSAGYKLCPYRDQLPATADDFLWSSGIFNDLGRFDGLGEEMREIVLRSLREYPREQIETALVDTAQQLRLVGSGYGIHDEIWHTYGIVKRFIPGEVSAMQRARQQHGEFGFEQINDLHVPIAWGSMVLALVLAAGAPFSRRFDSISTLAATVVVALLANAFVCGALSGPHDRYGARMAWIATLLVGIALALATRTMGEPTKLRQSVSP
jgi:hypothetical protein